MMNNFLKTFDYSLLSWAMLAFTLLAFFAVQVTGIVVFYLLPVAVILVALSVYNFKATYFMMLFFLPLSTEFFFSKSLATDLPTEPLIIGLMLVYLMYVLSKPYVVEKKFISHPLIVLLLIHWVWMFITAIFADDSFVAFKFLLAKSWYYIVFIFLTALIIKNESTARKAFWFIFIPLLFTAVQTLFRHYQLDFAFSEINTPVVPFFRNHVSYGTMLTLFIPFIFYARSWYNKGSFLRILLNASILIFFIGIYFSYTRACLLALLLAAIYYFIIKLKATVPALIAGLLIVGGIVYHFANDNRFMLFSPDFEQTVYHGNWEEHISATYQFQDASSMERIYRWIAGINMFQEKPLMGYGPNNFYPTYKRHTVSAFETYISDNEERSTIHNYYLLMLVEQGLVGFFLFLIITLYSLYLGQRIYSKAQSDRHKNMAIALTLSILMMYVSLQLSDLVETDKLGSLYFMSLALMVRLDLSVKSENEKKLKESTA
ncbi:MAG: O-antigen ligase family protein [Chitinophagaceae bacterium]|nr:MAG: O-antigen ligase family protein [Chitinophagaceae bacterium]